MYTLKDSGAIKEINSGNNFEYILEEGNHIVNTDYKVLQSQTNDIFVKCMKMMRNGKPDLYYVTEGYRPMSSMFNKIDADTLVTIVVNLFATIVEVRNNGFLACQCIDMSWDKIFVEQSTLKVKLVYLPLAVRAFDSYIEFENELRTSIVRLIDKVMVNGSDRLKHLRADLSDGTLSLEDVYNRSRGMGTSSIGNSQNRQQHFETKVPSGNHLKLVAMNAPKYFEIILDKSDMLLGKKQEIVDKAITFNNMISRKHCRITNMRNEYYISDAGSANGTYVNGVRLKPGQLKLINRGDIIRLANSDFQVV